MPKAVTTTTHQRMHKIVLEKNDLARAVAFCAADCVEHCSPGLDDPAVSYRVVFEDVLEGSPAYKVGTRAIITITEDLQHPTRGSMEKNDAH